MIRALDRLRVTWRTRKNLRVAPTWHGVVSTVMTREVPVEWEEELRRISPRTTSYSYLDWKWEFVLGKVRGEWQDRSRWVLYQMQPAWAVPAGLRQLLEDAPPRLLPAGRAYARRLFVDDWAHEMYRTQRVFPRPFWVIQGTGGGVPAGYSEIEAEILRALGEPTDPPPVGSLRYAPFDWRVVEQILMRDKLLSAGMQIESVVEAGRVLGRLRQEECEAALAYRRTFIEWFKGTLAPSADFLTWYTRRSESDRELRTATRAEMAAARETEDTFMETGYAPDLGAA